MKKIFLCILISFPFILLGQVKIDRTKAPAPGPAPIIKIGEPATFTLANGLKVFVVQNTKLPRVSATLTIDRESIVEGDKAGMAGMAGDLFRRGTTKMNKATLDEEIDYLGAGISTSATSVSGSSLKNNFSRVMGLMADIASRPAFPASELEKIRKQTLSNLAQSKDDPSAVANNVVSKLAYGTDHPYGEIETEASVKRVTVADIKAYYDKYWKPNIAYLIFVGDISTAEAKKLAEQNFGTWKKGVVPAATYKTPSPPAKTYIAVVDRPASVQSVITFITPIQLKPGTSDAIPSSLMNSILGNGSSGRLFKNLREQHGFTYGAYSGISSDRLVGNFSASASVRNEKTDSAIAQFLYEFNKMRTDAVDEADVRLMKNEMNGSFARSLESPATIANFALNVARYNMPKDYYQKYLTNLAAVTPATVEQMANKYIQPGNMIVVIVGNAKEISKGLEKYGEVKYFDIEGNEIKPPANKTVDASITPESILKKSIAAMGSDAAVSAIKDLELTGTASVMGQGLKLSQKYIITKAFLQTISMGEMTVMKQLVNNGTYIVSQQGTPMDLSAGDKEELDETTYFINENFYFKQPGYTFTMKGIEQVDGKDAYVIEVKSPKGRTFTNYYDLVTFFKVKATTTQDAGAAGKVTIQTYFQEYKPYNGVQVPVKMLIDQGPLKIDVAITDVKVNQGLKAEDLK